MGQLLGLLRSSASQEKKKNGLSLHDYKIYINRFDINAIQIESNSNMDYLKHISASKARAL